MCIWSVVKKVFGLYGITTRHEGQPRQNLGHIGDDTSEKLQGGTKPEW